MIVAVPLPATSPGSIRKVGLESPSAVSVKLSVPVIGSPSSGPLPVVWPPNVPGSLTCARLMVTSSVSVNGPPVPKLARSLVPTVRVSSPSVVL